MSHSVTDKFSHFFRAHKAGNDGSQISFNREPYSLRIDDRLETALRNIADADESHMAGQWRQLLDLLAQNPASFDSDMVEQGLINLHYLRDSVDLVDREASVKSLGQGISSAPLVQLLAGDHPLVAAAAIRHARLTPSEWVDLIPHLNTRARGFLRLRRDMGTEGHRALALWSTADHLLPNNFGSENQAVAVAITHPPTPEGIADDVDRPAPQQIGLIVERIEKWRRDRELSEAPYLPFADDDEFFEEVRVEEIRFETDDNGTISWAEGAPRGAIVGIDIARAAYDNGPGPDAYGAAAFRQRMPMESARMRLDGAAIVEGEWRITAAPFFDAQSGRFRGFRGIMRRPTVVETAALQDERDRNGDQMQQIVHELRTPLGAIAGFAEIIEQQLFGPVSREYRELAAAIIGDANRLLAGFDDLSMAARIDRGQFEMQAGVTECTWLAERLKERLQAISDNLGVKVNLVLADPVRPFALEPELAERIFARLLAATIIGCGPGELLHGRFSTEIGKTVWNRFQLALPKQLSGLSEEELLNSGPISGQPPAGSPLLGLGFSLRLVRNLARNIGGNLQIHKDSLLLSLPAAQDSHYHYRDYWGE